jgi:hypothetical protein
MAKLGSNFNPSGALPDINKKASDLLSGGSDASSAYSLKNFIRERDIDGTKWNKIFPYVFKIGSQNGDTQSDKAPDTAKALLGGLTATVKKGLSSKLPKGLSIGETNVTEIVLPIAPNNISISTPAASNITTTLRGIVEEHNGAPLRTIRISGTTGIMPGRANQHYNAGSNNLTGTIIDDIFSNTISAGRDLVQQFTGSDTKLLSETGLLNGSDDTLLKNTGYYFFHQLVNFVDQYLLMKKEKANKDKYLIFEMRKDDLYYKCSLRNFSWQKRQGTLEYDYTIELLAWAYEKKSSLPVSPFDTIKNAASTLNRISATVKKARRVMSKAKNVIKSFSQDVDRIFLIGNEMIMLANDTIGVAQTLLEMPVNIKKSWQSLITNNLDFGSSSGPIAALKRANNRLAAEFLKAGNVINNQSQLGPGQKQRTSSSSLINSVFNDPDKYVEFFEELKLDDYPASEELRAQVDEEIERVKKISSAEWIEKRDTVVKFSNSFVNSIGSYSEKYNEILGVSGSGKDKREIRMSELEILRAMADMIESLNSLIVLSRSADQAIQNYTDFYVNLAQFNGINISNPASKFSIPVPYGATIQSIALQYLGSAARWPEIAAINQLRSPFIDEDGFEVTIKGETSGEVITISNSKNLYVNQPVMVLDETKVPVNARIKTIEIIDNITVLVTLDQDVSGYGQSTNAKLKAYLPNTVNSNMMLYIPTNSAPNVLASDFKFSPDMDDQTVLSAIAGTDIMLNSEGDIAVLPSGDVKVSGGIANLVQAAKLKLTTPKGSLIQHPDYGLGVMAGTPTQEFDVNEAFADIERAFADDDRFDSVLASRITKKGGTVTIDVALQPPQTNSVLPLTVNLRK